MRAYLIRRLLLMVVTLFMISMIVFLTVRLLPGGLVDVIMADMISRTGERPDLDREAIERLLGLDAPIYVQYGRWMGVLPDPDPRTGESRYSGLLQGSLGDSLRTGDPVATRILGRLATTVELGFLATVIGLLIALPIGIYSAIRQDNIGDYIGRSCAIIFISVPSFWAATMVILYPSIWWNWSPPIEVIPFMEDPLGNLGMFIIPSFILGMLGAGGTMRLTRSMMLEVLRQDYIRTAWSKGLSERVVVVRHAVRNALIPVVTDIGAGLPLLVGGAVIMEQIFVLPGIGRLMLTALSQRDYTTVSGINLLVATGVVGANLLVDISYAYLDPRVRYR